MKDTRFAGDAKTTGSTRGGFRIAWRLYQSQQRRWRLLGLGKLYKHAKATNVSEVRVDLVKPTIMPPNAQFAGMIAYHRKMLARQLAARTLPSEWLTAAEVVVRFTGRKNANQSGDTFECSVTLTDDRARPHQAQADGFCWPHSPWRESKSTRA